MGFLARRAAGRAGGSAARAEEADATASSKRSAVASSFSARGSASSFSSANTGKACVLSLFSPPGPLYRATSITVFRPGAKSTPWSSATFFAAMSTR